MSEEPKRRRGCGLGCLVAFLVGLACIFVIAAAGVYMAASAGGRLSALGGHLSHAGTPKGLGEDEMPRMREIWSAGHGDTKVARIRLHGMIALDGGKWSGDGEGSATTALRAIRRATADDAVEAILLEVDSPGGGITDSDVIYHALQTFRGSREGRVVVTLMGDVAASGGYYVALASDRILAHPTTLTGSIGVLIQSVNLQGLTAKLGIKDVTIKSGENKDILNPLRELSPAQVAMLQQVVDALHARFVRLVAENRKLPEDTVKPLADGRVFLADQALEAKLIDAIGYVAEAEGAVAELLETDSLRFIRYVEEPSFMDIFRAPRLFGAAAERLLRTEDGRLMYKWSL
ncbi:MAG: signal peptide peptidase SppA [Kiritimatiellae bacterium]|nr:signal peptide peptidase SppA [Kiritimatiellia bacterium]